MSITTPFLLACDLTAPIFEAGTELLFCSALFAFPSPGRAMIDHDANYSYYYVLSGSNRTSELHLLLIPCIEHSEN